MARRHHRKSALHALAGIAGLGKTPAGDIPGNVKKAYSKADDAAKAAIMDLLKPFMPAPGLSPQDRIKAKAVVNKFVMGKGGSHGNITSTGTELKVKGATVATRASKTARSMTVCPGKFGGDKESRAAANAVLDLLQAGIAVQDRETNAYLSPHVGGSRRAGRIESNQACYQVEVPKSIDRQIALEEKRYLGTSEGKAAAYAAASAAAMAAMYGPGGSMVKKPRKPAAKKSGGKKKK